jgi:hypothetical protein
VCMNFVMIICVMYAADVGLVQGSSDAGSPWLIAADSDGSHDPNDQLILRGSCQSTTGWYIRR